MTATWQMSLSMSLASAKMVCSNCSSYGMTDLLTSKRHVSWSPSRSAANCRCPISRQPMSRQVCARRKAQALACIHVSSPLSPKLLAVARLVQIKPTAHKQRSKCTSSKRRPRKRRGHAE